MNSLCKILCLLFIPIGSCEHVEEDVDAEDLGYPSEITFPAQGGERRYVGNDLGDINYLEIFNFEGLGFSYEFIGDEEHALYRWQNNWITIDFEMAQPILNLHAQPNSTGEARMMEFTLVTPQLRYAKIKIKQEAN